METTAITDPAAMATAIAKANLYAADNEADEISADFPQAYKDRIPARGTVAGETRLAKARELVPAVAKLHGIHEANEAQKQRHEQTLDNQRDLHKKRGEESEHFQQWEKQGTGKPYVPLHDGMGLTTAQMRAWAKPRPATPPAVPRMF